ncbi:MAG TPA: LTA synthase family protein [Bacteroidales bacterium]|nr:LTA synthase family protein [Bacteroidales bacterium]
MKCNNRGYYYLPLLFAFWMFVFALLRLMFYWVNAKSGINYFEGMEHGWRTDLATTGYLVFLPAVFWFSGNFFSSASVRLNKIGFLFSAVCFTLICFIDVVSLPLFPEWGSTFNLRAITSTESPGEAAITFLDYFKLKWLLMFLTPTVLGIFALHRIMLHFSNHIGNKVHRIALPLIVLPLLLLGMRGNIGKVPIQVSSAFYSHNQTANFLAVNKTFYFVSTLKQKKHLEIESIAFDKTELAQTWAKLYPEPAEGDTLSILTTLRPNIVVIVLEGCPADVFEPLGGFEGISPNFTELCKQGLLFNQIYASGFRTDQGMLNILSGLPALPFLNLMSDTELSRKYPSVLTELHNSGYFTSYMYGGDAGFSNFSFYFRHNNISAIVDKNSFSAKERCISWGVPDNFLFQRAGQELNTYKQPFFACIMTQSTHSPFDLQEKPHFPGEEISEKFKSSAYFTDSCIASFLNVNRNSEWYRNTIFIVVSDHGSLYLGNRDFNDHNRFRIPLLFYGEVLKPEFRGKTNATVGNSHDLPATLLTQLGLDYSPFPFSKNLLATSIYHHAFWITEQNIGWITSDRRMVFNFSTRDIYFTEGDTSNNKNYVSDGIRFYKILADYALKQEAPPRIR